MDAFSILPEHWRKEQGRALLNRPLFDSATYGRIRFHHRRIAEYLAAQWFRKRMAEGCPTQVLLQHLFDDAREQLAPRQSLIPATAWLCPGDAKWNGDVRARVLQA